jgi:L-threonylcarbamoyladenylate synthase
MKTVAWTPNSNRDELSRGVAKVLGEGGVVCVPCNGRYRLLADLTNVEAVLRLVQAKGRVRKAPALVFIDSEGQLSQVAEKVEKLSLRVARKFWPNPLTIRVKLSEELPTKVRKQLGGNKGKIGVRIPADPLVRAIIAEVGRPLLVSSANRERKSGESSPAQIRKNFSSSIDMFIERGDLQPGPASTVIDVKDGEIVVERAGMVSEEQLAALAAE